MSALIYIETSIPSFYHETRTEAQFQTMREWTLATFHECDILATWNCHRPPALLARPPASLFPSSSSALRAKAPPFGYLAPLGCRHIANVNKREHIHRVNVSLGFATPLLTTPFELLEQLP